MNTITIDDSTDGEGNRGDNLRTMIRQKTEEGEAEEMGDGMGVR